MSFIDFFENSRPCQIVALGSPGLASTCCSPKVPGLGFCAAGSLAWQEDPMPCFLQGFAEIFLPWSRKQICSTLLWPPVRCWDMSKISQAFSMKLRQNEIFYPESSSDLKWPLWASSTFLPQELNRKGWERRGRRNYIRPRIRKDRQEMRVTDTLKKSSPHSVECRWLPQLCGYFVEGSLEEKLATYPQSQTRELTRKKQQRSEEVRVRTCYS